MGLDFFVCLHFPVHRCSPFILRGVIAACQTITHNVCQLAHFREKNYKTLILLGFARVRFSRIPFSVFCRILNLTQNWAKNAPKPLISLWFLILKHDLNLRLSGFGRQNRVTIFGKL